MEARIEEDTKGRRHVHDACVEPCAIERGMRIIGGKWTGSILWHLKDEPVRFNDLSRMIAGASILERIAGRTLFKIEIETDGFFLAIWLHLDLHHRRDIQSSGKCFI